MGAETLHASAAESTARRHVEAAADAMGGVARLRALTSLRVQGIGHWYLVAQPERPASPTCLVMVEQRDELHDLRNHRLRHRNQGRGDVLDASWALTMTLDGGDVAIEQGGQTRPGGAAQLQDMEERRDYAPERVLITALDAPDLSSAPDTQLRGMPHHVVTFRHGRASVRLYLDASTALPTMVETVDAHPADYQWSVWGDVRTRLYFQVWTLEPGGLRYPRHWLWERNDEPYHAFTVTAVSLDEPVKDADFAISDEVKRGFEARRTMTVDTEPLGGRAGLRPVEMAPGVVKLPGTWDAVLVRQDDGVVVLEGPVSPGYTGRVLDEAARRFPGSKVKALVSTTDAWPPLGGLREAVARDIPLHVLDRNRSLVERLLKAPHSLLPDALEKAPRAAKLHVVGQRTPLGTGTNRIELIPARTETGERTLLVWLPEHRLLYTSDLVRPAADDTTFDTQQVLELEEVARREKLEVVRIFGMHLPVTAWESLDSVEERHREPLAPRLPR